jgi:hypothetical protein
MGSLERYWGGVLQRLRAEVDVFSALVEHHGERGRANELALASVLERFLPDRWAVGTGLVVDRHDVQSRQMDIVIYERSDQAALFAQATELLHPVETVIACIEVKTTVTKRDIERDFAAKRSSLADLTPSAGFERPFLVLLAYNSEPSPETLASLLQAGTPKDHVDLACVLEWCLLGGTAEMLACEKEYSVGNCVLQEVDETGRATGDFVETNTTERQALNDGMLVPVVRRSDGKRYLGDPGRTLLLFLEALLRVGAKRHGQPTPIVSEYLEPSARTLLEVHPK